MEEQRYKVYGRRWLALGAFMLVNLTIQTLWISYAPVAARAAAFFGVSEFRIGLLAMVYMFAFIPLSIPVSWLIDRFGFFPVVGAGSALTAGFGLLRGLAGADFGLVFLASCGLAAAQPALLNAWTKMPAAWFPAGERATAVGLLTLANLVGTALGLVLTPILAEGMSLPAIQLRYGLAAALAAFAFLLLARERPPLPPDASASSERALHIKGMGHALASPSFRRYLAMAFLGMGVFNGVTTWIEAIVRPRGVDSGGAGILGALMLVGGVMGAVAISAASDRVGKRAPFIALGLAGAAPALLGLAFAPGFLGLAFASVALGFFLVSVNPVGMQYASEAARPTPEGTSNGLVSLAGQASVLLVWAMEALNRLSGGYAASLSLGAACLALCALLALSLKEASQPAAAERP